MSERREYIQGFSDYHKEAYGIRPKWDYNILTLTELKEYYNTFEIQCGYNDKISRDREAEGISIFLEIVSSIQITCNCDYKKAVKYLMDAENLDYTSNQDKGYFCYLYHLPYEWKL